VLVLTSDSDVARSADKSPVVVPQSVIIIEQTRENHENIVERIQKVRHGEPEALKGSGGMGGGGGFGGGAF
jgi:hypothetical protein